MEPRAHVLAGAADFNIDGVDLVEQERIARDIERQRLAAVAGRHSTPPMSDPRGVRPPSDGRGRSPARRRTPSIPPPPVPGDSGEVSATKYTLQLKPKMDWTRKTIRIKIEPQFFAEGNIRLAFKAYEWEDGQAARLIVAKSLKPSFRPSDPDRHVVLWSDVQTQTVAAKWAEIYNTHDPPKKIMFLPCWMIKTGDGRVYACEPMLDGKYEKHNNNAGHVSQNVRNTPHAFSHFTWHYSKGKLMVVDIQGVADIYTDPQIHTRDGQGYGAGNLGMGGVKKFFETHQCNNLCIGLKLNSLRYAGADQGHTIFTSGGADDPAGRPGPSM